MAMGNTLFLSFEGDAIYLREFRQAAPPMKAVLV